jgi:hypothetical protein
MAPAPSQVGQYGKRGVQFFLYASTANGATAALAATQLAMAEIHSVTAVAAGAIATHSCMAALVIQAE